MALLLQAGTLRTAVSKVSTYRSVGSIVRVLLLLAPWLLSLLRPFVVEEMIRQGYSPMQTIRLMFLDLA